MKQGMFHVFLPFVSWLYIEHELFKVIPEIACRMIRFYKVFNK